MKQTHNWRIWWLIRAVADGETEGVQAQAKRLLKTEKKRRRKKQKKEEKKARERAMLEAFNLMNKPFGHTCTGCGHSFIYGKGECVHREDLTQLRCQETGKTEVLRMPWFEKCCPGCNVHYKVYLDPIAVAAERAAERAADAQHFLNRDKSEVL